MNKPIFGTREWASRTENLMFGCQHDCLYCYAKAMSIRHKKIDIERWNQPIIRQNQLDKDFGYRKGTTMFPSTHDIHPDNLDDVIVFLNKLLRKSNDVLIVSKPHIECIKRICDTFQRSKDNILFRFTIGSANDSVLRYWEPNAPDFVERLSALKYAFDAGFETSVSMEPMLDIAPNRVIHQVRNAVTNSIWLGKMNFAERRIRANGHEINRAMLDLVNYWEQEENIMKLYRRYRHDPLIKWKESIKKAVGLDIPVEAGLDV